MNKCEKCGKQFGTSSELKNHSCESSESYRYQSNDTIPSLSPSMPAIDDSPMSPSVDSGDMGGGGSFDGGGSSNDF